MNLKIINGNVYDPETGSLEKRELYVTGEEMASAATSDARVIDAAGCIVTTGLIDFHVHFYNHGTENGVNPDAYAFPCGITTAVDAGSAGVGNYEAYRNGVMAQSDVRILNQLLMGSGGQTTDSYPEHLEARYFNVEKIKAFFKKYADNIVGLKSRMSIGIIAPEDAEESIRKTVALAEELGCHVTVHMTNPCIDPEKLASILRPGDVICHIYQGKGETILDAEGYVRKGIMEAHERGVLIDASNGRSNYDLEVCQAAIRQGLKPDIISCDINTSSFYLQPLHSLPRIMSKYLDMGMTVEEVLKTVTKTPADVIRHPELASLAVGTPADISILKIKKKELPYSDCNGHTFTGHQVFVPQMTIKDGKVMYCQADFQ